MRKKILSVSWESLVERIEQMTSDVQSDALFIEDRTIGCDS